MSGGGLLDDQFADALVGSSGGYGLAFTLLGEAVTYTEQKTPGTDPVATAITAVRVPTPDLFEPETSEQTGWVFSASDISDPQEGDTITDDGGDVWAVVRTAPQNGGVFVVTGQKAKLN